jgi:hypothetical protein
MNGGGAGRKLCGTQHTAQPLRESRYLELVTHARRCSEARVAIRVPANAHAMKAFCPGLAGECRARYDQVRDPELIPTVLARQRGG